jgi:hypothetical protein
MKKIFAAFCAIVLMPSFSAQAWIGGPFSNNTFLGETGADGVYEASATAINGIGLFRITVGNEFEGVNPGGVSATNTQPITGAGGVALPNAYSDVGSGNTVFGAYGSIWSNVWFYRGVSYRGNTLGTVNYSQGSVVAVGEAYSSKVVNPLNQENIDGEYAVSAGVRVVLQEPQFFPPQDLSPQSTISSSFKASLVGTGGLVSARSFSGTGRGRLAFADTTAQGSETPRNQAFKFTVFGTKISDSIFLGL